MRTLIALSALLTSGVASAQTLATAGSCPGDITVTVDGLTPGATAVFLLGPAGEGSDVIGIGGCAGTVTGLAGLRFGTRITADGGGMISATPYVGDPACDMPIQVLDTATCSLSNVDTAGSADGFEIVDNELLPGDGYAYASIDDAPVIADYGTWINNCQTDPMPLPDGWSIAPNTPGIEDIIYAGGWSTHCMLVEGGCTYGTYNYGYGNCYEPCGLMGDDGFGNYWATSCSRRVMIRRPL
ncbi:MAG: hypothetical protein ACI8PZ_001861 [Myxococcota bacterium]|jgi:hypothetical protein